MRRKDFTKQSSGMRKVLMCASVASMIDQFNLPNICLLQKMGYVVHVACNFKEGNTCDAKRLKELKQELCRMQVVWHQWDCPRSVYAFKKCCVAYRQLWKLTKEHIFAWIHCHSPVGGALARMVAHQRNIRVIYTAHGFHFYRGAPFIYWFLYYPAEKLLSYWTDVLITVNKEDYRLAKRKLRAQRVYRIPGVGIDVNKFGQYSVKIPKIQDHTARIHDEKRKFCKICKIPEDAVILLSVGELNKGKNHQMVLTALASMKRLNIYYLICGQGSRRKKLEQYAARLGVRSRVRMLGYQKNMPYIYQHADIFVFPSIREGMPVALMEAMAAGMPCVVSDIRGNRELIDEAPVGQRPHKKGMQLQQPGGMRFQPQRPRQLRKALELLVENEVLRKQCGAYNQTKIRNYAQEAVQEKMRKIYAKEEQYAKSISNDGCIQYGKECAHS